MSFAKKIHETVHVTVHVKIDTTSAAHKFVHLKTLTFWNIYKATLGHTPDNMIFLLFDEMTDGHFTDVKFFGKRYEIGMYCSAVLLNGVSFETMKQHIVRTISPENYWMPSESPR